MKEAEQCGRANPCPCSPWTLAKIMKFLFCAVVFCCAISHAADDWKVQAFDTAQALFADFEAKEAAFLTKAAPETKPFFDLWLPMMTAYRDRDRIAFLYKITHSPNAIDWSNIWVWSAATSSTEEVESLVAVSSEYAEANKVFQRSKESLLAQKDLFKLRNQAYQRHETEIRPLESEFQSRLQQLQSAVDKETKS